jgi:hypothetical protein
MTVAVAPVRERHKPVRGWRGWRGPTEHKPFPSLGWLWLDWTYAFLPSPADELQPLVYTDEQARRLVRWAELDPVTGDFVYLRLILEEAKGFGKSPMAATLDILDLAGPVCFDGWDADGEPVGVPWGTGLRPPPWVQIAAVSEDQTENTYGALYSLMNSNGGRPADALRIDAGRTRLFLRDRPGRLEPVTASAGSREGQRLTKFTADETQLWNPSNGGLKLIRTLRRNVAKMNGRGVETTNSPTLGEKSVAEMSDPDHPDSGVLHYARRPRHVPDPADSDESLLSELVHVYSGAPWISPDRLLRDIRDPSTPWDDSLRYFFNVRTSGEMRAIDPRQWDALAKPREVPAGELVGAGFDGSEFHDATVIRVCTADGYSFIWRYWARPPGVAVWQVPRLEVEQAVAELFSRYTVGLMLCDPPRWWTEIATWQERYTEDRVKVLDTYAARQMAPAVDRWRTAIRAGTHTHDGDPFTADQVKATRLKKVRVGDAEDDRTMYLLDKDGRIGNDAAIADCLAYEAAMTMTAPPPKPKPFVVYGKAR